MNKFKLLKQTLHDSGYTELFPSRMYSLFKSKGFVYCYYEIKEYYRGVLSHVIRIIKDY
jgi:hypothetical protein